MGKRETRHVDSLVIFEANASVLTPWASLTPVRHFFILVRIDGRCATDLQLPKPYVRSPPRHIDGKQYHQYDEATISRHALLVYLFCF